jgi:hypothetical protein
VHSSGTEISVTYVFFSLFFETFVCISMTEAHQSILDVVTDVVARVVRLRNFPTADKNERCVLRGTTKRTRAYSTFDMSRNDTSFSTVLPASLGDNGTI